MSRIYEWYLHGYTQAALSSPSVVSAPGRPTEIPDEQERAAFAIGVGDGVDRREHGPEPKASVLASVASLFAEADPDSGASS